MSAITDKFQNVPFNIMRAFEKAYGQWTGCDWTTDFDIAHLDLRGVTSAKAAECANEWARLLLWLLQVPELPLDFMESNIAVGAGMGVLRNADGSRKLLERAAASWERARDFLRRVESVSMFVQDLSVRALECVEKGDWYKANEFASACLEKEQAEKQYATHPDKLVYVWKPFFEAVNEAFESHVREVRRGGQGGMN